MVWQSPEQGINSKLSDKSLNMYNTAYFNFVYKSEKLEPKCPLLGLCMAFYSSDF